MNITKSHFTASLVGVMTADTSTITPSIHVEETYDKSESELHLSSPSVSRVSSNYMFTKDPYGLIAEQKKSAVSSREDLRESAADSDTTEHRLVY